MQNDEREHLFSILKDFDRAMLVSRTPDGHLRSRPMVLAGVHENEVCFATALDSPKVQELERDPNVNIAVQGKTQFVSLSGTARVLRERSLIDRLWSEGWKVWFPNGKDDPHLCVLAVDLQQGEYWDDAGAHGIKYLFEAMKAYATGTTPHIDPGQNAKVPLQSPPS